MRTVDGTTLVEVWVIKVVVGTTFVVVSVATRVSVKYIVERTALGAVVAFEVVGIGATEGNWLLDEALPAEMAPRPHRPNPA